MRWPRSLSSPSTSAARGGGSSTPAAVAVPLQTVLQAGSSPSLPPTAPHAHLVRVRDDPGRLGAVDGCEVRLHEGKHLSDAALDVCARPGEEEGGREGLPPGLAAAVSAAPRRTRLRVERQEVDALEVPRVEQRGARVGVVRDASCGGGGKGKSLVAVRRRGRCRSPRTVAQLVLGEVGRSLVVTRGLRDPAEAV